MPWWRVKGRKKPLTPCAAWRQTFKVLLGGSQDKAMDMNVVPVAVKQEVATEDGSEGVKMDVESRKVSKPALAIYAISSPRLRPHDAAALRQTSKRKNTAATPERETSRKKIRADVFPPPAPEIIASVPLHQPFDTLFVARTGGGADQREEPETLLPVKSIVPVAKATKEQHQRDAYTTSSLARQQESRKATTRDKAPAASLARKQESQASTRKVVVPPPLAHPKPTPLPTPQPSHGCVLVV
jgi:hypothetical protein